MKNNTIQFFYVDPVEYELEKENKEKEDIYLNQNLKATIKGKTIKMSSQNVISELANYINNDKLVDANKQNNSNEKIIQYSFKIASDEKTTNTIKINIPAMLQSSVYAPLVISDIIQLDKLATYTKKTHKERKIEMIIAALTACGLLITSGISLAQNVKENEVKTNERTMYDLYEEEYSSTMTYQEFLKMIDEFEKNCEAEQLSNKQKVKK